MKTGFSKKGLGHWKSSAVGMAFFLSGFALKIKCLYFDAQCASSFQVIALLVAGLVFLFLDEEDIKAMLDRIVDRYLSK